MLYSILIIVAIIVILATSRYLKRLPEQQRQGFFKKAIVWMLLLAVLGLVVTGRAHWLMAALAGLLAVVGRIAQFVQYIPLVQKLFGKGNSSASSPNNATMSRQQAADILGVDVNASADEVKMAHKKLMQKMHPDRGGSDVLAKQINQARDTLLS